MSNEENISESSNSTLADIEGFGVKRHQKLPPWRHWKLTPYAG